MDYGYINARVKGMNSILFDRKSYDNLILKADIDSLITELEKSPYKNEIEEGCVLHPGILGIEYALRKNLIKNYRKILGFVRGDIGETYIKVFLNRWDIQNIKTIMRGKNIHASQNEILECLVPAGELDEATLTELMKQQDIRSVIDLLATWQIPYSLPLTMHLEAYSENNDLAVLEYALDKYYYENSLKSVAGKKYDSRVIHDLLAIEIDIVNIKTILRVIRDSIDREETEYMLLSGGKILDQKTLLNLISATSIRDVVRKLESTPYSFLSEIPEHAFLSDKISVFEKELDKYIIKKGIRTLRGDPLSISIVIGYLWAKFNEITNIRIIARCKNAYISDEELQEELIYV
jgi:V/A-type H+-transporting ATPase subunit C